MNEDALSKIKGKLKAEIDALEHELNLELPKELMKARAHGDLSENAEYKYAKERQGFVSARLGQLKKRMGDLGMLNLNNIPHDRAGYGSRVWLKDGQGFRHRIQAGDQRGSGRGSGVDLDDVADRPRAAGQARGRRGAGADSGRAERVRAGAAEDDSRRRLALASLADKARGARGCKATTPRTLFP